MIGTYHCGDCEFETPLLGESMDHDCTDVVGTCEGCETTITLRRIADGDATSSTLCAGCTVVRNCRGCGCDLSVRDEANGLIINGHCVDCAWDARDATGAL